MAIGEYPEETSSVERAEAKGAAKTYFGSYDGEVVPEDGTAPGSTNVFFVANSFEEFLYSLKPDA